MEPWIAVLAVVVAAIGIAVSYRQSRPAQKLAERDLIAAPALSLEFAVYGTLADEIIWILPWRRKWAYLADLDMVIGNIGSETVEDVVIILEVSSDIYPADLPRIEDKASRLLRIERVADETEGKPITRVTYKLDAIHPGAGIHLGDLLLFTTPTRTRVQARPRTADGHRLKIKGEIVFGYHLSFSIMARNVKGFRRDVSVATFDIKDPIIRRLVASNDRATSLSEVQARNLRTARFLIVNNPDSPDLGAPPNLRRRFARARVEQAETIDAAHLSESDYVRLVR